MIDRNELKTLLVDMELSYAIGYFFPSKKPQYISAKQIKHHQWCPCAAWQWDHEVSAQVVKVTDDKKRFKKNFRDDFIVAKKLHELMSEADVIVAHNGDAFDIKHANTLFINHDLGPIPEKKSIDTLKSARKYFNFAGNSLADLLKRWGFEGKMEKPDWFLMTDGNAAMIDYAAEYCLQDVKGLRNVFHKIKPYIRRLPYLKEFKGGIVQCHACGSKRLHKKGGGFDGSKMYLRIRCFECGHEHKGKLEHKK